MVCKQSVRVPFISFTAVLALVALMLAALPASAASCQKQRALVAGRDFVAAARQGTPQAFARALARHVDMNAVAMFALGKHRRKLPSSRRARFVSRTADYIARTLSDFALKFRALSVEFVRCRGSVVETKLLQGAGRADQKVLMRFSGARIIDVYIQNIWLGQLLRSNFDQVITQQGGFDALWKKLG